jgi:hypothetical protein
MPDESLSFCTDDELWDELSKRNVATLLVFCKRVDNRGETHRVFFSGGTATCLGLAQGAVSMLSKEFCGGVGFREEQDDAATNQS